MSKLTREQKRRLKISSILFLVVTPIIFLVSDAKTATLITSAWIAMIASTRYLFKKQNEKHPITEIDKSAPEIPFPNETLDYYRYIRDNRATMKGSYHYLGWLLRNVDLNYLENVDFNIRKLSASNSFFISTRNQDAHTRDTLLALEAALNCTEKYPAKGLKTDGYKDFTMKLLFESNKIRYKVTGFMGKNIAYNNTDSQEYPKLDYYTRIALATGLEGVFTIYRFASAFKLNWPKKTAYIRVHTTHPDSLRLVAENPKEQIKLARDLSLRDVAQAAQLALSVETVEKVCVELIETDSIYFLKNLQRNKNSVAHATFTREDSDLLDDVILKGTQLAQDAFDISYALDDKGWFVPHKASYEFNEALQQTPDKYKAFPLHTCNNTHFMDLFFAKTPADFNYAASKVAHFVSKELSLCEDKSCKGVVKALTQAKELANDSYTKNACDRTIHALVTGKIEPDDEDALDDCLLYHHANIEENLSEILYGVTEKEFTFDFYKENLDGYLHSVKHTNTNEVVYICPGSSMSERIAYNRAHADDTRQVELLPDSYSNVLAETIKAYVYADICTTSEIQPYVDELLRIGDTNAYNISTISKFYIKNSQPYLAIGLCKNALKYSVTKFDAAIFAYVAAYACWQANDLKTATALYLLAKDSNTDVSKQARNELSDLVSEHPEYKEAQTADLYEYLKENGWATSLQESYKLSGQTPPTNDLTYDELMRTGAIYAVDEGMYDLGYLFIEELPDKDSDLISAVARSLIE